MHFICVDIVIVEKKGKKRAIIKTDPKIKKDDYNIWNRVNSREAPLVDRKTLALVAENAVVKKKIYKIKLWF